MTLVNYLWSIPIFTVLFLFFFAWVDKDKRVFQAGLFCLIAACVWPFSILFTIFMRFFDWYEQSKRTKNTD